jgi:glutamyl endopeptidase
MRMMPFTAMIVALASASPGIAGNEAANPATDSALVSDHGDFIPLRPASASLSSAQSPSWRGTGLIARIPLSKAHPSESGKPASFPNAGSIIGADRRVRARNTTAFPARATTFITFKQGTFRLSCTGWLIGKDTVATAGHCLNGGPGFSNLWSKNVTVYPGRDGDSSPYGSCGVKKLWTNSSWLKNGDEEHDYGAIKLDCTIGDATGWYGFFWTKESLTGAVTKTRGYPNDKAHGTQWLSKNCAGASGFTPCHIMISQPRVLYYDNDTMGGQSGSPVYEKRSGACDPCGMAVHGYGTDSVHTYNSGARITRSVFNFLTDVVNR